MEVAKYIIDVDVDVDVEVAGDRTYLAVRVTVVLLIAMGDNEGAVGCPVACG